MGQSDHAHSADAWDIHAGKWASSVQQITVAPCTTLLSQCDSLSALDAPEAHVLDNGAGSGQLTGLIKAKYPKVPIIAADISKGMLESLAETAASEGWETTRTVVQDAQDLNELSDGTFSHVVCSFMVNFTSNPQKAITEMHRVLRSEGVLGMATWSRVSWVPLWETAVRKVQGSEAYKAPSLFHQDTVNIAPLQEAMEHAGFKDVNLENFKCFHPEKTIDSAVEEFYGMGNPSIKLLMKGFSEDFIEQTKPHFRVAYDETYNGGKEQQFELAILAVGRKAGY